MPNRQFDNHFVSSDSLPEIKVQISVDLEYIGTQIFSMGDMVEVEVFVFVQTVENKGDAFTR